MALKTTVAAVLILTGAMRSPAASAPFEPPVVAVPPTIDGDLTEPMWAQALVVTDFYQRVPTEGAKPEEPTAVYLAYTRHALYIGVRAYDSSPAGIVRNVMKRDDWSVVNDDQFAIAIDSYNDKLNGYWFSTNPLGARVDAQFFNEGDIWESDWDGVWVCRARVDETGWSAEIEIPFSTLRFEPRDENVMGINLFRRVIRTNEQIFAPAIPLELAYGTPNVSAAREYVFKNITGGSSLRVKPYTLLGAQVDRTTVSTETVWERDFGVDARYDMTSSLTANLSINTDFAQAEIDERQVNLTRFDLFFPEKRDFFLENAGNFAFGLSGQADVYFSRRVGLAADSAGSVSELPILFGAKVTGKIGGVDVGAMDVQTRSSAAVPSENVGVLRIKRAFAPRSYVGAIATSLWRQAENDQTFGIDGTAYLGGNVGLRGFMAARVTSTAGFRSDGQGAYLSLFRAGERASFDLSVMDVGARFDPAVGFVPRKGIRKASASVSKPWYIQTRYIRRLIAGYEGVEYRDRADGTRLDGSHTGVLELDFQSDDKVRVFGGLARDAFRADFTIFDDVVVPAGDWEALAGGISFSSKAGRALALAAEARAGEFLNGDRKTFSGALTWRPSRHLTVSPFYEFNDVELSTGAFEAHLARVRVDVDLNTHFSVSALVQYDNGTDRIGSNVRATYLVSEGTEIIVVLNEQRTALDPDHPFGQREDGVVLLKVTYLLLR